jgi:LacI family transcriptional regulator
MLVTQRTSTLAVVFQYADLFSSGSGFINEVMKGVCDTAVEEGYDLMLHTRQLGDPRSEADALSDGRVEGALVLRDQGDETSQALRDRGFPTVQFFTRSDDPQAAWVDADNFSGARMAVRHLLELGHKRIGMVMGPAASIPANDRFQGYRDAMENADLPVEERFLIRAGNAQEALKKLPEMLQQSEPPTALFVWADDVAIACLEVARNLGVSVPNELSVVGFDSLEICNRTVPPLTSVRQPIHQMAAEATRLLIALSREDQVPRRQLLFPLSLDLRGSTAPVSVPYHTEVIP